MGRTVTKRSIRLLVVASRPIACALVIFAVHSRLINMEHRPVSHAANWKPLDVYGRSPQLGSYMGQSGLQRPLQDWNVSSEH
jgi:hypothetical protein